jgi:hypothetical protein
MVKKFHITEDDRRSILSMHNLLTEETKYNITVKGVVTNTLNEPLEFIKVTINTTEGNLIKGSLTNVKGEYTIQTTLDVGDYTLKFFNGATNITEKITVSKEEIFTIDKMFDIKVQELDGVQVTAGIVRIPMIDINVSDEKGNKLDGAKISILSDDKEIDYSIFDPQGTTYAVNTTTKQTKEGSLKNIVIDTIKYPEFVPSNSKQLECTEKKEITIKVDFEGSIFTTKTKICLNNAYYSTNKTTGIIDTNVKYVRSTVDTNAFSYSMSLYYEFSISVVNQTNESIENAKVVLYTDSSKKEALFTTKTDDTGTFNVKLKRELGKPISFYVDVTAKKYQLYNLTKEVKAQNEKIKIMLQPNDLTSLKIRVFDQETDDMVGPGIVEIYYDVNKTVFVGQVNIKTNGVGDVYLGSDSNGTPRVSEEKSGLIMLKEGRVKLYLYSFEQGYDEFFKSYTFTVYNDGSIVTLDVPINYFKEQDDDNNQEDFPLKKRKRFVYGESIKKYKTEEESIQDARKEALKSYVTNNKKYMDRTDLNDAVPTGGEVIYLHKYDDGTYYTVVKFKKRDLKKFLKTYIKKEEPVVLETKEIKFTDISLTEALKNSKMGDEYMVFAVSVNGSSSKKLLTDITSDDNLLSIINTRYTNIKVTNDTNDKNYQIAIDSFKLPGFPCVFIIKQGKSEPYFKNERGSIYLQLVDYFK